MAPAAVAEEEAVVEEVAIAPETLAGDAEQRLADAAAAAAEEQGFSARENSGLGTRFWNRVTDVWPLQPWFPYDGSSVKVRNSSGEARAQMIECLLRDSPASRRMLCTRCATATGRRRTGGSA